MRLKGFQPVRKLTRTIFDPVLNQLFIVIFGQATKFFLFWSAREPGDRVQQLRNLVRGTVIILTTFLIYNDFA